MINLALVGYGAMGKEIERLCPTEKIMISSIFDINAPLDKSQVYDFDTAIEFSTPTAVLDNIRTLAEMGKSIVCGTTGWYDKIDYVKEIVQTNQVGFVYASNFSIGMRLFFKIVESAAKNFNGFSEYDVMLHELHHKRKIDSPSGTAISLAEILLHNIDAKKEIVSDKIEGQISPNTLHVSSTRGGEITGTHMVYFDSIADTIELTHRAKNRSGLALGALQAVELINGNKGFYEFGDLLFADK
ncbi:MAG: 4-hydroxy-tetrahydrodipicolinate reductase [bacterium]